MRRVRAHYAKPPNVGRVPDPWGKAIVRSPLDNNTVQITLRIEKGVIQEIKCKCRAVRWGFASSSVAKEMVLGKPVKDALQISKQAVADLLGGIPEYKMRCSNLAPEAIRQAIEDWRTRDSEGKER